MKDIGKGMSLTLTEVLTNGTLADVKAGDSFEITQLWYDRLGNTRGSISVFHDEVDDYIVESHIVIISEETLTFAPDAANINTVARYEVES